MDVMYAISNAMHVHARYISKVCYNIKQTFATRELEVEVERPDAIGRQLGKALLRRPAIAHVAEPGLRHLDWKQNCRVSTYLIMTCIVQMACTVQMTYIAQ